MWRHRKEMGAALLLVALMASPLPALSFVPSALLQGWSSPALGSSAQQSVSCASLRPPLRSLPPPPLRMASGELPAVDNAPVPRVSKFRFAHGSSTNEIFGDAIKEALREAQDGLPEDARPTCMTVLLGSTYCHSPVMDQVDDVPETLVDQQGREVTAGGVEDAIGVIARIFAQRGWTDVPVIGSTVGGFITPEGEQEGARGLTVTLGYLPGVKVVPFSVPDDVSDSWSRKDWASKASLGDFGTEPSKAGSRESAVLLLAHPSDPLRTQTVLSGLSFAFPDTKIVGGVAGTVSPDHEARVFMFPSLAKATDKASCTSTTAVGLCLEGEIAVDAVVAQGARPIGPNFEVTEVAEGGRQIVKMKELASGADSEGAPMMLFDMCGFMGLIDMADVQEALGFVAMGVSLNPLEEEDMEYIVRPISDLERDGPVLLTQPVRPGQIVRFHVRDGGNATAELDSLYLRWQLERTSKGSEGMVPAGAMMFADEYRGKRMFGEEGREVDMFKKAFPGVGVGGGFFTGAIGELPNFKDRNKPPADPKGAEAGGATLPGIKLDAFEKHIDKHSVATAYCMIYGPELLPEQDGEVPL